MIDFRQLSEAFDRVVALPSEQRQAAIQEYTASAPEIAAELRRSNDLLHKLVDGHEARIAALEEKSTGRKGGAKP